MANGDVWTVINSSYLRIRSGPGTSYSATGTLNGGDSIIEIGRANDTYGNVWIQHSLGWSSTTSGTTTYLQKTKSAASSVTTVTDNSPPPTTDESTANGDAVSYDDSAGSGYQPNIDDIIYYVNNNISDSEFVKIKNVAGVFGLPYQFLPNADIRLSGDTTTENIGYEYADKIVERIPILFLTPGKASFMTKYSEKNKESLLEKMISFGFDNSDGSLDDLLTSVGKYYTFEYDMAGYYKYVNPMCRIAARFLNIHDVVINGSTLDTMNWEKFVHSGISSIMSFKESYRAVPFYVDADSSISENFSNSTTQSMLASSVNSISDMGRELNFLLGYGADVDVDAILNDPEVAKNVENVNSLVSKLLGGGNFLSNLGSHLTTVASGGKLIFPEIWADSSFSRTYNCEFKFVSPDPSKLSVYLNVLVPLFHLLGMVAPQSDRNNPNGYKNPFLVRAVYKGFFNVDMGIITDMSVTKGAECQWTPEGIPTSITVSITIKDLYSAMSITSTESLNNWQYDTLNNTALMDYIANLCGINIFKPEIGRTIDMWIVNNFVNRFQDFFETDIWVGVADKVQNLIMNIFR